jgi:leucyl/phenylalanyl-tRNA---protein transferase
VNHPTFNSGIDPDDLLEAYRNSFFPMADPRTGVISWYSPDPRAIVPLEGFRVPRSLRRIIQKGIFSIRLDTAFRSVIEACAEREQTWISREIIVGYANLHKEGFAHSVESWMDGQLVGGLYGVSIGGAFFGESMFSRITNASKVALVSLVEILRARRFRILDTQFMNEHVRQFGAIEVSRSVYRAALADALQEPTSF